jgi:hypothetical protein
LDQEVLRAAVIFWQKMNNYLNHDGSKLFNKKYFSQSLFKHLLLFGKNKLQLTNIKNL